MTVPEQEKLDFTMMYATHRAFRRDLDRLVAAAEDGKAGTPGCRHGWETFKDQLLVHHSVEDAHLWPALRNLVEGQSRDLALLDEMEAEHAQLGPLLAAVDQALADRPDTVSRRAQELMVNLSGHLKHEEDDALPLVQSVLPKAWRNFTAQMRRRQGVRGAAVYVPWALDGAAPAERRQFLGALPAPVRLANHLLWERRYRNQGRWQF